MADQVNPMGSLGSGSTVVALPMAKPVSSQDKTASPKASPPEASQAVTSATDPRAKKAAKDAEMNPSAINAQLQQANSSLQFKVDKSTGISYFKVVDAETGKVIRQVPSAEVLAMAQKLQDFSNHKDPAGILMDQQG